MNLEVLAEKIDLQLDIRNEVEKFSKSYDFGEIRGDLDKLKNMKTEKEARKHINEKFSNDTKQIKMLTCMLVCATEIYQWYKQKGISDQIYFDTMKCFTRFIAEHKERTGEYAFDRAFWTARQISGTLFRIGELEYEMITYQEKPAISVHIPSDAVFTEEKCNDSISQSKLFFSKFFIEFSTTNYICESWLMMPELKSFLNPDSNIVKFQNRFQIIETNYNDKEYLEWIFKTKSSEPENLPEKTTLQRNLKNYILKGGKFGSSLGIMKK